MAMAMVMIRGTAMVKDMDFHHLAQVVLLTINSPQELIGLNNSMRAT